MNDAFPVSIKGILFEGDRCFCFRMNGENGNFQVEG
ncbi:hypothetical protein ERICIV_02144 [Paenibacillus larvae subsp. larvae]|uniref:Uncharacterized protein n=1 Tax=Paenibacillus larvae subsp. larvae TaxID=147375 RepID=A0A2L1U035_9BACL|nr:hypothetical protein ERICIII_02123 [Paenibacillus larvae subsp. larvae]AVF31063.1 hypothetical protein ERICIV_02144 [Paenibacillus larvae subsp. larvae]